MIGEAITCPAKPVTFIWKVPCPGFSLPATTVIADKGYDADERVLNKLEQAGKIAVIPPKAKLDPMRSFCRKSALFCRKKRPVLFHVEPNAPNPAANRASAPQSIPRATAATEHFYYRTLLLAPKGGHS